jgi:glyoxylase-like metal-dependent hydrolase (beta-lactamase superfamily II)
MGRANTRGDLVVYLPDDRIVATGDILVAPVPFSFGSFLGDWLGTLGRIRALDVAVIVPGHGPVQRDWSYLDRVSRLIESTLTQVRAAVAAGKDLDSTRAAVNLSAFEKEFGAGSLLNERAFRGFFVTPAVERAFREARGELQ